MITFRRAVRENIGLIIGLAGPSGGGKTLSAMRLAHGLSGGRPFAFIDTESGRGKHYADSFEFDHADLSAPFRPSRYAEAIKAADAAKYPVIVVDSCSHEHAGDGGLLDWHEEELDRITKDDWKRRESCNMAAWIKPKMDHKQFVTRLLQVRAHIILCFRAEQKVEMKRVDGKMEIVPKTLASGFSDWIPICEKNMLYELTASFLLTPDAPGVPKPIKLPGAVRPFIALKDPLDEQVGIRLAEWSQGKEPISHREQDKPDASRTPSGDPSHSPESVPTKASGPAAKTMTAANACQQFILCESIQEASGVMNQWQGQAHLHTLADQARVVASFAEAKKQLGVRK